MPPLRIFISYGRDQYAPLAARLAADLKARGYEVWFDQQLKSGRSWAGDIQERLDWLAEVPQHGRFVYLLSQHSTRRASFCLSELQYAIDNYVPVFPVLVEKCKIPIEIYPLHRLDFRPGLPVEENQAAYAHLVDTLAADMEGEVEPRLAQQRIIEEQTPSGPPAPGPTPAVEVRSVKPIAPPVLPPAPVEEVNPSEAPPPQSLPQPPAPEGEIHLERLPVELAVPVSPPPQPPADPSRWLEFLRGVLQQRSGRTILFALFVVLVVAALVLLLPGGLPVVFSPATRTLTVPPTATPTSTLTSTLTLTPSVTVTPTRTATPTLTPSPTSTLMPPNCTGIGQTWKSPIDGMILVCVPAGEFLMGSTDADKDSQTFEKPQHTVHLDAFWIDQTEVTNAMFTKFISASGYRTNAEKAGQSYVYANNQWSQVKGADWQHPSGPGSNLGDKETFPAIHVNWNDAKAYCEWAGRQLPSEAQWEKAARGADGRLYPWGNQAPDNSYLNYKNFKGDTTAVKSYEQGKSPYDAYDMAGNVYEWVADWYDEKYYSSQSTWRNPGGPGSSPQGARVNRGGSWINGSGNVRAADRFGNVPANTSDFIGFRCAR